jgi:hypothetical protein
MPAARQAALIVPAALNCYGQGDEEGHCRFERRSSKLVTAAVLMVAMTSTTATSYLLPRWRRRWSRFRCFA